MYVWRSQEQETQDVVHSQGKTHIWGENLVKNSSFSNSIQDETLLDSLDLDLQPPFQPFLLVDVLFSVFQVSMLQGATLEQNFSPNIIFFDPNFRTSTLQQIQNFGPRDKTKLRDLTQFSDHI